MDLLQCLMDSSSHAIFTLDRDGIITHINQQAKVRFGLYHNSQHPHPAGRLEPGDLVLIADTAIGADDGALRPEDLARIGIREPRLRVNDRLVAAGVFDMPGRRPVYKFLPDQDADSLCLETVCEGIPIRLSIERRSVTVTVRDTVYTIGYFRCIGQMVVLDGATGRVKFWQEKGYSARREGIGHLLRGGSYSEKRAGLSLQVEGYHFRDFFEGAQFERDLARVLNGQAPRLEDREYEINGFELVATLLPVPGAEGGRPDGVIVKFRNIEDIHVTILERNNAIKMAERTYRETARKDAPQEASFAERFGFDTLPASVRHRVYKLSQLDCGILITGENGTGKSFLAQAIRQAQPRRGPFVTVDCATISPTLFESEMFGYVGGAFTGANPQGKAGFFEAADGGNIFLDEIGEIPPQIQAKLLSVIQNKVVCRVGSTRSVPVDVRILAATNRPETLDQALLRPGRFDRRIPVELPDLVGREAILKIHANDVKMEPGIDLGVVARSTPGASGADLANIINEAALRAVRFGRSRVTQEDLLESVDVVIAGEKKKSTVLSQHEKEVVSYHETGHAIVAAMQKGSAPVSKITIVPRTSGALGFTMQVEEDEHFLTTRQEAKDKIAVLCGGRAAEELIFSEMTTGASNDIEKATQLARAMVTQYGMSDKFGMVALGQQRNRYLGGGSELTCSEGTAQEIDAEVQRLVEEGHQTALRTLRENRFKLHEIAHYLQKKETITGEEFMSILNQA